MLLILQRGFLCKQKEQRVRKNIFLWTAMALQIRRNLNAMLAASFGIKRMGSMMFTRTEPSTDDEASMFTHSDVLLGCGVSEVLEMVDADTLPCTEHKKRKVL